MAFEATGAWQPVPDGFQPPKSLQVETINGKRQARLPLPKGPDLAEALRFLTILDDEAERFHFQTATDQDHKTRPDNKASVISLVPTDLSKLAKLNANGAAVWVMVNAGTGRKAKDVHRIRAVFGDFDGRPIADAYSCGLTPHVVTETSPGHFQPFWLVDGLDVELFEPVQRRIAETFGTDHVIDPSRVMRLPGFWHQKREPFMVRIVHASGELPYSADDVLRVFPPLGKNGAVGEHGATIEAEVKVDLSISAVMALTERLNIARANDVELAYAWDVLRGWDKADGSPDWSSYDMAIASRLARAGFSDPEIGLAIVMFREQKCSLTADKAKPFQHRTYLKMTIGKARAGETPPPTPEDNVSREVEAARAKLARAMKAAKDLNDANEEVAEKRREQIEARGAAIAGDRERAFDWISRMLRPAGDLRLVDVVRVGNNPGHLYITFDGYNAINFGPVGRIVSPAYFRQILMHAVEKLILVTKQLSKQWPDIVELMLKHAHREDAGDFELSKRIEDLIAAQVDASGAPLVEGEALYAARKQRQTHIYGGEVYVFARTLLKHTRHLEIGQAETWGILRELGYEQTVVRTKLSTRSAWKKVRLG